MCEEINEDITDNVVEDEESSSLDDDDDEGPEQPCQAKCSNVLVRPTVDAVNRELAKVTKDISEGLGGHRSTTY